MGHDEKDKTMNTETPAGPTGLIELLKDTSNPMARLEAAKWATALAEHGPGDWGEAYSATRAARLAYGMDVPEIRAHVVEQFVFWMRFAEDPMKNQAALDLCRHLASVEIANPTDWRAIIAEAVEILGQHVRAVEISTPTPKG